MSAHRFDFPGFTPKKPAHVTGTCKILVGTITVGDELLIVHMIQKVGISRNANFCVGKVRDAEDKNTLWSFKDSGVNGNCILVPTEKGPAIAVVERGENGKLTDVVLLSSLLDHAPPDIRERIEIKHNTAGYLRRECLFTQGEWKVLCRDREAQQTALEHKEQEEAERKKREEVRKKMEAEQKEREDAKRARRAERRKKALAVMARRRVQAYAQDGTTRSGVPVLDNEWHILDPGTPVILVESYDNGKPGAALEAFKVLKQHGKPAKKGAAATVSWENPLATTGVDTIRNDAGNPLPQPVRTVVVEDKKKALHEVAVYDSFRRISEVRRRSHILGTTYVTAEDQKVADGQYTVFHARKSAVDTIGVCTVVS